MAETLPKASWANDSLIVRRQHSVPVLAKLVESPIRKHPRDVNVEVNGLL